MIENIKPIEVVKPSIILSQSQIDFINSLKTQKRQYVKKQTLSYSRPKVVFELEF